MRSLKPPKNRAKWAEYYPPPLYLTHVFKAKIPSSLFLKMGTVNFQLLFETRTTSVDFYCICRLDCKAIAIREGNETSLWTDVDCLIRL